MTDTRSDSIHVLNHLIRSLKDAEIGFDEASRDVREEDYRKMFAGYARKMGGFAAALREQVVTLGGKPADAGTVSGQVRRVWMHMRAMLNLDHKEPVLLEGERMEESLLDHYEKAVESLPASLKEAVEKQYVDVIEIRNHLLELTGSGSLTSTDDKKFLI
jgi:uncharacterized protein (TIGR02284 family)